MIAVFTAYQLRPLCSTICITCTTLNALSIPSYSSGGYGPFAIFGTSGNETVNNYGAVIGNVNLGTGSNVFNNKLGGTLVSGPSVMIGGTLTNDGAISLGGLGNVFTTFVSGNLVQGGTGALSLDLDFGTGTADRINVSGFASLSGSVVINPLNPEQIKPATSKSRS
ncbi:MAG: hypothetical protein ACOH1Q_04125 [Thiobacillus sp.]